MHIGERIKTRADKLGVTAKEIAKACGITDKAIYRWFKEPKNIRPENLVATAKLLKTTVEWLVNEEAPEDRPESLETLSPEAGAALKVWEALPTQYQETMLLTMQQLAKQLRGRQWIPGVSPERRSSVRQTRTPTSQ